MLACLFACLFAIVSPTHLLLLPLSPCIRWGVCACVDVSACSCLPASVQRQLSHLACLYAFVRSNGGIVTDGDGTVPLVSLGLMCVDGWLRKQFNPSGLCICTRACSLPRCVTLSPARSHVRWSTRSSTNQQTNVSTHTPGIRVVTREYPHLPTPFDPRGGPATADHVDIMGNAAVMAAVLHVAAGTDEEGPGAVFEDRVISDIHAIARRVGLGGKRWDRRTWWSWW